MTTCKRRGGLCVFVLAFLVMTGGARATSANTDLSDIWWNPNESGWGMQMVNTGTFVFATIYVYGPNGTPTWLTGQLNKTGAGQTTYTGPLYVTTGPYYGGFFNPNAVTVRQAGTMTFILMSVRTGQLNYSVDGVVVNKTVQRQTLPLDNYTGNYLVLATQSISGCFRPAENGTFTGALALTISQNGPSMTVVSTNTNGGSCTYTGTYFQLGHMGQTTGTYFCGAEVGEVTLFEMTNTPYSLSARMQSHSTNIGCNTVAEFAGVVPR